MVIYIYIFILSLQKLKKVTVSNLFVTNFKPKTNFKSFILNKSKKQNRIFSKNFFLFLLLIKFNNKTRINKMSLFVKKCKKNVYTTIRSPYRHKLARHQLSMQRYCICTTIFFKLKKSPFFLNFNNFLYFYTKMSKISG